MFVYFVIYVFIFNRPSDASKKKGTSVMQTSARLVKGGKVCDVTLGLSVPKNGESSTEADAMEGHTVALQRWALVQQWTK